MTHLPFWFAQALQKSNGDRRRQRLSEASENTFERVVWEIGVLLVLVLALSAIVGVSMAAYGIN
jgi:hypothetical protein